MFSKLKLLKNKAPLNGFPNETDYYKPLEYVSIPRTKNWFESWQWVNKFKKDYPWFRNLFLSDLQFEALGKEKNPGYQLTAFLNPEAQFCTAPFNHKFTESLALNELDQNNPWLTIINPKNGKKITCQRISYSDDFRMPFNHFQKLDISSGDLVKVRKPTEIEILKAKKFNIQIPHMDWRETQLYKEQEAIKDLKKEKKYTEKVKSDIEKARKEAIRKQLAKHEKNKTQVEKSSSLIIPILLIAGGLMVLYQDQ